MFAAQGLPIAGLGIAVALSAIAIVLFGRGYRAVALAFIGAAGCIGTISATEAAARLAHEEVEDDVWSGRLSQTDAMLGTSLLPNTTACHERRQRSNRYAIEWKVCYHTDSDGARLVPGAPARAPEVGLFGCSFTFGEGLDDADTLAARLQSRLPELRIRNYGVRGHGTAQHALMLDRVLTRTRQRVCVLGFVPDHVRRTAMPYSLMASDWASNHPRVRVDNGRVVFLGRARDLLTRAEALHVLALESSILYRRAFGAQSLDVARSWAITGEIILAMDRQCREQGGTFLLVLFPSRAIREFSSEPARAWRASLEARGVRVLDLASGIDAAMPESAVDSLFYSDGHPRAAWAVWVAAHLASEIHALTVSN